MKINEISLLGLLAPIWLALGLQLVLFLQPGSLLAASWLALALPFIRFLELGSLIAAKIRNINSTGCQNNVIGSLEVGGRAVAHKY